MRRFFLVLLLSFSTLLVPACVTQQMYLQKSFQKGKIFFEKKQYHQAFINLYPVAQAGNSEAQYAIGYLYYYGNGVVEDKNLAHYWILSAAHQGNKAAIRALNQLKDLR